MYYDEASRAAADKRSAECARQFNPREDKTRQELTADCDLNLLLSRYEPYELPMKETFYGEVDYTLDNSDAAIAVYSAGEFLRERDEMQAAEPTPEPQAQGEAEAASASPQGAPVAEG